MPVFLDRLPSDLNLVGALAYVTAGLWTCGLLAPFAHLMAKHQSYLVDLRLGKAELRALPYRLQASPTQTHRDRIGPYLHRHFLFRAVHSLSALSVRVTDEHQVHVCALDDGSSGLKAAQVAYADGLPPSKQRLAIVYRQKAVFSVASSIDMPVPDKAGSKDA